MFSPTDIITIFGMRGSGKSTLGKNIAFQYPRLVVIDRLREWQDSDTVAGRDLITDNFREAIDFLVNKLGQKEWRLIFQFDVEQGNESQNDTLDAILRTLYKRGSISGENVCLLIEEVHFFASTHSITQWISECIFTGRHANLSIIASSQRPATVAKALVSQSAHVFIGQLYEKRDIDYFYDTIGEAAEKIPSLEKFSFLHYQIGKPHSIVKNTV